MYAERAHQEAACKEKEIEGSRLTLSFWAECFYLGCNAKISGHSCAFYNAHGTNR
jgi:hypothetical protein